MFQVLWRRSTAIPRIWGRGGRRSHRCPSSLIHDDEAGEERQTAAGESGEWRARPRSGENPWLSGNDSVTLLYPCSADRRKKGVSPRNHTREGQAMLADEYCGSTPLYDPVS
ncbi:hypothetical protein OPV22_015616 [Ensete ventricosum]|uniref:Uncharacterized protein n=1 Tax=Ensete ventricosum TaxID=4639 RepID=A0AAV8RAA7_ENSVE|nr:hypothetical protein OPV22_015616 [Ensete ventricosum]